MYWDINSSMGGSLDAAFASPMGCQTHMMLFGPGGYRFVESLCVGISLDLIVSAAVILIPTIGCNRSPGLEWGQATARTAVAGWTRTRYFSYY